MFFKGKIRCSDFWVTSHDKPSDFYLCAWQRGGSPRPLLCVRLALAAAAAGILTWSLVGGSASPLWLIFLTNWGLVLVAATALAALFVSCMAAYETPPEGSLPRGAPLYWLLFNVSQSAALAITLLYWTLLYNPEGSVPRGAPLYWLLFNVSQSAALAITLLYWTLLYNPEIMTYPSVEAQARDVATHALNSALTLVELLTARVPARLLHAWQPLSLAALYIAFSAVYYASGGTNPTGAPFIYPVLDWRRPAQAGALAGGALAGVLALHALVCALAAARRAAAESACRPAAPLP